MTNEEAKSLEVMLTDITGTMKNMVDALGTVKDELVELRQDYLEHLVDFHNVKITNSTLTKPEDVK